MQIAFSLGCREGNHALQYTTEVNIQSEFKVNKYFSGDRIFGSMSKNTFDLD